ncbi:YadA-like family protein, partial [uncultured Campylobacter sp.]|uniref:YadA family autotransporter adhesin n=1 Tax=uncultured Campylobacter sp. TaxID=218934 RepID=UPI00261A485D
KKYTFGDTTLGNTSVVTNEILTTQLNNLSTQISNKDFNITLAADKGNAITTKTNKQIGIVGANGNIKTEANGTHLKIGLSNNVEFDKNGSKNGSIVFATGQKGDTNITKNNVTSKDIVATNGTNTVKISGESGTITGLTNTEWNGTTDDISRAATEGQLQKFTQLLQKDINKSKVKVAAGNNIKVTSAVDATTGATTYTVATSDDVNFTKVTVGNTIIQNNNISVGKNISITDKEIKNGNVTIASNSIDINRIKLDKDGLTITSPDANKTVSLTKDGLNNGGNKITNVADGVAANDAATVGQLQKIKNVVNNSPVVASVNKDHWAEQNATATGKNSVSIGGGSSDDNRSNTVSVGAKGHERTISNVAPGIKNSDAATVGQLKSGLNEIYGQLNRYKKQSSAGTAAAMAIGNMPQSTVPGKGMISLGGGFYDGQSAMAIGLSKMSDDGRWVVKGSASYDSQDKAGASVAVGFHF